jgi:isopentenyldiphosphate isomerase
MPGRVAVVTAENRFIRWTDRQEVHRDQLIHRSVQVLLFDPAGKMILQRRHPDKLTWADAWDVAVSGHVEEEDYMNGPDEDLDVVYHSVAERECREELGVEVLLERRGTFPPEPGVHYEVFQLFTGTTDGPFTLQADEVAEVGRFDVAGWRRLAETARVTPTLQMLADWALANGVWR